MRAFSWLLFLGLSSGLLASAKSQPPAGADETERILKLFRSEFVPIAPGTAGFPADFMMGSSAEQGTEEAERPAHLVRFSASFAMAKFEATQELYEAVMGKNPSRWKGKRNSVEMTSWLEAVDFCERATAKLRAAKLISMTQRVRLPSEAEWEYCCRAGTKTAYGFGDDPGLLTTHGWFNGNSKGEDPPVGKKKPNPWGLFDMHGYVWEWCGDSWHDNYQGAPAASEPWNEPGSNKKPIRGGSWADPATKCRSATREGRPESARSDAIGFRCVLDGPAN